MGKENPHRHREPAPRRPLEILHQRYEHRQLGVDLGVHLVLELVEAHDLEHGQDLAEFLDVLLLQLQEGVFFATSIGNDLAALQIIWITFA